MPARSTVTSTFSAFGAQTRKRVPFAMGFAPSVGLVSHAGPGKSLWSSWRLDIVETRDNVSDLDIELLDTDRLRLKQSLRRDRPLDSGVTRCRRTSRIAPVSMVRVAWPPRKYDTLREGDPRTCDPGGSPGTAGRAGTGRGAAIARRGQRASLLEAGDLPIPPGDCRPSHVHAGIHEVAIGTYLPNSRLANSFSSSGSMLSGAPSCGSSGRSGGGKPGGGPSTTRSGWPSSGCTPFQISASRL
jgi:hypothetical protein